MQKIYQSVYDKLVEQTKVRKQFIGCHKHRICPGYEGGLYDADNVLFLTQREHATIHFLRWKLLKDTRDKRAYKMIGIGPAGLSHEDRVDHGHQCAKQKLGMHGASQKQRSEWRERGRDTQRKNITLLGDKNWVYWSTPIGRKERSSLGGKKSSKTNKAFIEQQSSFKKNPGLAAEASKKSGKKPATDGTITKKFLTEEKRDDFLKNNPSWRRGCHWTMKKKK